MAVDYGLHAILTQRLLVRGHRGDRRRHPRRASRPIKTMMTYGVMSDDGQRWGMMSEVAEHGGMSVVHAEDDAIANWLTGKYLREGKTPRRLHLRDARARWSRRRRSGARCSWRSASGSPLYVLHMAAGSGVEALAEARARGPAVLRRDADRLPQLHPGRHLGRRRRSSVNGTTYNAARPALQQLPDAEVRRRTARPAGTAIADDRLQVVGTDHCARQPQGPLRDRWARRSTTCRRARPRSSSGFRSSIDHGVQRGRSASTRWVELISTNPAKIMGMWPQKGADRGRQRRRHRRLRSEQAAGPCAGRTFT